jgi:hypothetical protein
VSGSVAGSGTRGAALASQGTALAEAAMDDAGAAAAGEVSADAGWSGTGSAAGRRWARSIQRSRGLKETAGIWNHAAHAAACCGSAWADRETCAGRGASAVA